MITVKYDWNTWFALPVFRINQGEHYRCSQGTMAQQVRNAASRRGIKIHLMEGKDYFVVSTGKRRTSLFV